MNQIRNFLLLSSISKTIEIDKSGTSSIEFDNQNDIIELKINQPKTSVVFHNSEGFYAEIYDKTMNYVTFLSPQTDSFLNLQEMTPYSIRITKTDSSNSNYILYYSILFTEDIQNYHTCTEHLLVTDVENDFKIYGNSINQNNLEPDFTISKGNTVCLWYTSPNIQNLEIEASKEDIFTKNEIDQQTFFIQTNSLFSFSDSIIIKPNSQHTSSQLIFKEKSLNSHRNLKTIENLKIFKTQFLNNNNNINIKNRNIVRNIQSLLTENIKIKDSFYNFITIQCSPSLAIIFHNIKFTCQIYDENDVSYGNLDEDHPAFQFSSHQGGKIIITNIETDEISFSTMYLNDVGCETVSLSAGISNEFQLDTIHSQRCIWISSLNYFDLSFANSNKNNFHIYVEDPSLTGKPETKLIKLNNKRPTISLSKTILEEDSNSYIETDSSFSFKTINNCLLYLTTTNQNNENIQINYNQQNPESEIKFNSIYNFGPNSKILNEGDMRDEDETVVIDITSPLTEGNFEIVPKQVMRLNIGIENAVFILSQALIHGTDKNIAINGKEGESFLSLKAVVDDKKDPIYFTDIFDFGNSKGYIQIEAPHDVMVNLFYAIAQMDCNINIITNQDYDFSLYQPNIGPEWNTTFEEMTSYCYWYFSPKDYTVDLNASLVSKQNELIVCLNNKDPEILSKNPTVVASIKAHNFLVRLETSNTSLPNYIRLRFKKEESKEQQQLFTRTQNSITDLIDENNMEINEFVINNNSLTNEKKSKTSIKYLLNLFQNKNRKIKSSQPVISYINYMYEKDLSQSDNYMIINESIPIYYPSFLHYSLSTGSDLVFYIRGLPLILTINGQKSCLIVHEINQYTNIYDENSQFVGLISPQNGSYAAKFKSTGSAEVHSDLSIVHVSFFYLSIKDAPCSRFAISTDPQRKFTVSKKDSDDSDNRNYTLSSEQNYCYLSSFPYNVTTSINTNFANLDRLYGFAPNSIYQVLFLSGRSSNERVTRTFLILAVIGTSTQSKSFSLTHSAAISDSSNTDFARFSTTFVQFETGILSNSQVDKDMDNVGFTFSTLELVIFIIVLCLIAILFVFVFFKIKDCVSNSYEDTTSSSSFNFIIPPSSVVTEDPENHEHNYYQASRHNIRYDDSSSSSLEDIIEAEQNRRRQSDTSHITYFTSPRRTSHLSPLTTEPENTNSNQKNQENENNGTEANINNQDDAVYEEEPFSNPYIDYNVTSIQNDNQQERNPFDL